MITRSGYIVLDDSNSSERKRELTVRPVVQGDYAQPPSFKVYKQSRGHMCVPRYYGTSCIGKPNRDTRVNPNNIYVRFTATLKPHQIEPNKKGIEALEKIGGGVLKSLS